MPVAWAKAPRGTVPDIRKEFLETRHLSFHTKDVAHSRASEKYANRGRRLGLTVVILSTIVGTSVFASLERDPGWEAKLVVGLLSLLAALAAAVKDYEGCDKVAAEHRSAARGFRKLRYRADELLVALGHGDPDAKILAGMADLDAKALEVEEPPLPNGSYAEAEAWVHKQVSDHTRGGATNVL